MTTDEHDAELRRFFDEQLLPVAQRVKAKGDVFPMGPDPSCKSYWIDRTTRTLGKADFEEPSMASPAELGAKLAAMWTAKGDAELAKLAPAMQKLATGLAKAHQKQDDVSPFIYVMY
jgi:hypothetical protein